MLLEEIALMITGAIQITGGKMKATVVVDNIGNDELKDISEIEFVNADFVFTLNIRMRKYCWMQEHLDFFLRMQRR